MKTTQTTRWALCRCSQWGAEFLQSSDEALLLMSPFLETDKDISVIESCYLLPGSWAGFTHGGHPHLHLGVIAQACLYYWLKLKHWAAIWRMGGVVPSVVCHRDLCKGGGGESWVMQNCQCWIQPGLTVVSHTRLLSRAFTQQLLHMHSGVTTEKVLLTAKRCMQRAE